MKNKLFDAMPDSFRIVVHDDVPAFDRRWKLSVRNQNFVKKSAISDDEIAALQRRNRRLFGVKDESRLLPTGRQKLSSHSKVGDVTVTRKDGDHQRKGDGSTLWRRNYKFFSNVKQNDRMRCGRYGCSKIIGKINRKWPRMLNRAPVWQCFRSIDSKSHM